MSILNLSFLLTPFFSIAKKRRGEGEKKGRNIKRNEGRKEERKKDRKKDRIKKRIVKKTKKHIAGYLIEWSKHLINPVEPRAIWDEKNTVHGSMFTLVVTELLPVTLLCTIFYDW